MIYRLPGMFEQRTVEGNEDDLRAVIGEAPYTLYESDEGYDVVPMIAGGTPTGDATRRIEKGEGRGGLNNNSIDAIYADFGLEASQGERDNWIGWGDSLAQLREELGAKVGAGTARSLQEDLYGLAKEELAFQKVMAEREMALSSAVQRIAKEKWDEFKSTYGELEEAYFTRDAKEEIPEEYFEGRSDADARLDTARAQQQRSLGASGIDPSSPAFAAGEVGIGALGAAGQAGARTGARLATDDAEFSTKSAAVGLGKGIPSESAQMLGTAGSIAQSASSMSGSGLGSVANASNSATNIFMNDKYRYDRQQQQLLQNRARVSAEESAQNKKAIAAGSSAILKTFI